MVRLTPEVKAGFLRALYLSVIQGNVTPPPGPPALTLIGALNSFTLQNFQAMQSGRTLTATTGVGRSAQFMAPAIWQSLTPENVVGLAEEFQQCYTAAVADLAGQNITANDDGGAGTTKIFNTMLLQDNFQEVTRVEKDFTLIALPYR